MYQRKIFIFIVVLALVAFGCGVIDKATGGDTTMTAVAELWSDVPPMDGMTASQQIEMPLWLKALSGPIMDEMMKSLNDGNDAGHWDWTVFTMNGTLPADAQAFYTPERMASYAWQQAEAACMPMTEKGVLCSFIKEETGKTTGLIIIAATDDQQKETSIFFLRAEGLEGTPTVDQPAQTSSGTTFALVPIPPIPLGPDLSAIDLCQAIPQANIEAVMGRKLSSSPQKTSDDDSPGQSGCMYEAANDAEGNAYFGYIVLTPVETYENQPLYLKADVSGLGQEAYFNNGAAARELWVKVNDQVAFVVAFGDVPNEAGAKALAELLVNAMK